MSRLHEFKELSNQIELAWQRDAQTVLVILTDVKGSAYRLPGTKMLMTSDGEMFGTISGGCLEADLYEIAKTVFDSKIALKHRYDLSENEIWSLGIGCKGDLEFLFLPVLPHDAFWLKVHHLLHQEQPFTLLIDLASGSQLCIEEDGALYGDVTMPFEIINHGKSVLHTQTRAEIYSLNNRNYYIDAVKPSERLIVVGAGQDAIPVVNLANKVGFAVTVLDSRAHFNNEQRFPQVSHLTTEIEHLSKYQLQNCWWIIMNHHQEKDQESLRLAIESCPRYIGVLGPIYRTTEMLENIGYSLKSGPIYSPVGLDIGAETIDEVAISIVAELMSKRAGRTSKSLHGTVKIHG